MIEYSFREPGNYKSRMWIPNFTPSTWPALAYIRWKTAVPFSRDISTTAIKSGLKLNQIIKPPVWHDSRDKTS